MSDELGLGAAGLPTLALAPTWGWECGSVVDLVVVPRQGWRPSFVAGPDERSRLSRRLGHGRRPELVVDLSHGASCRDQDGSPARVRRGVECLPVDPRPVRERRDGPSVGDEGADSACGAGGVGGGAGCEVVDGGHGDGQELVDDALSGGGAGPAQQGCQGRSGHAGELGDPSRPEPSPRELADMLDGFSGVDERRVAVGAIARALRLVLAVRGRAGDAAAVVERVAGAGAVLVLGVLVLARLGRAVSSSFSGQRVVGGGAAGVLALAGVPGDPCEGEATRCRSGGVATVQAACLRAHRSSRSPAAAR